ncbi:MAG: trigger factor [bacterium]|nr:trigger factor [bacterium]
MAVKTESVEKNLVKLTFEVAADEFEKACNAAYRKNVGKFNINGYRKGKAPKAIIEKLYPGVFYDEAVNAVLPAAYESAVKESELDVVARPEIDVEDIKKGEPIVFTALVTTKPEVKLGQYKGVEVDKIDASVTDEDVDKDIAATQQRNARMIDIDDRPVQMGDVIKLDFKGSVDGVPFQGGEGSDYSLEIGSNTFIPGFEDQLVGAEIDKDIDVKVTFPEEYHAEDLAGKDAVFACRVKEIQVKELPELDDDFASEVSEFDTMEEYRADVRKKLEKAAEDKAKVETENAVIDKVVANAEVDVPAAMVEEQVNQQINDFAQRLQYQGMNLETYLQYTGSTRETMADQFRPQAETQVKNSLVIEAVMKAEGIEATEEDVEFELVDMAKRYNMELDKIKEIISDAEKENIKSNLSMQKTVTMLANNAVVK